MQLRPNLRFFRLADGGVTCGADGLFVGGAPTLRRAQSNDGGGWTPRSVAERDEALGEVYGLPIDSAAKQGRLAAVARALDCGDLALASIGAVLLRFPDPPALTKDAPPRSSAVLAAQLAAEGLLKADWDSSKHPRLGGPPNPGWFAATDAPSPPATPRTGATDSEGADESAVAASETPIDAASTSSDAQIDADGLQSGFWSWRKALISKFGRAPLEDPRNIVWVPRLKHELITGYFNGEDQDDGLGRIRRRVVSEMDFESQFQAGLDAMRLFGVLE